MESYLLITAVMPANPLSPEQLEDASRVRAAFDLRKQSDPSLTQERLAHKAGWKSQGAVSQYMKGRIPLNLDALLKFAIHLCVAPVDISPTLAHKMHGAVQVGGTWTEGVSEDANIGPGPDPGGRVPLISWVRAGAPLGVEDHYHTGDAEEWLPCPVSHGPRTFVLRVRGISMENPHGRPTFADGDLIFVDPDREPMNRSLIIAKMNLEQEATFKQLQIEGERQFLKALNPAWPEPMIELDAGWSVVGVVIGRFDKM